MENRLPQHKPNVINVAEAWQGIWDDQPPDGLECFAQLIPNFSSNCNAVVTPKSGEAAIPCSVG
jgi:hypothetical protein